MKIIKRSLLVLLTLCIAVWLIAYIKVNYVKHSYAPVTADQLKTAQTYMRDQVTPVPEDLQWQMFEHNPGVRLRSAVLEHPQAKGTVVVIPGFTGSIEMIMREITTIHQAGYRVAAIEYRGQGLSYRPLPHHPEKGYVEDYAILAEEVGAFANNIRDPELPLFFFSISKGAHITMRMAAEQNVDVDAYALIVPMIHINTGDYSNEKLKNITGFMNKVGLGAAYSFGGAPWPGDEMFFGEATDCNANPNTAQVQSALFAINQNLRTRSVTFKWLYETINSTEKLLDPDFVKEIYQPVKVYTAGIDTLVRTDKAEEFCSLLADCKTQHYPQSRHCITREDYELYDSIIADAITHYESTIKTASKVTASSKH